MKFTASAAILIFSLLFSTPAFSQDYTWHSPLSLSLSLNYSQLREENINPNPYSGPGLGLAIARRIEKEGFYQSIEFSAYAVVPKSSQQKSTKAAVGTGSLKYNFMLSHIFGTDKISAGLFAEASMKEFYFTKYGHYTMYWANSAGVGGAIALLEPISNQLCLEAIAELPLAGFAFRPAAKGRRYWKNTFSNVMKAGTSDGEFALPGKYLNPSLQISLLSSGTGFLRGISYKYTHYEVKTAVSNLYWENSHALMVTFGLGKSPRG